MTETKPTYEQNQCRLRILLEDSERPVIAFGVVNNYANFEQVVKELEPNLTKPILARRVEPDDLNPFHILAELPAEKPTIVFAWFAGSPLPNEDGEPSDFVQFARYLNYGRERIQMYKHSMVLFFTDELLQEFIQYAPDFWSWRQGVFGLEREVPNLPELRLLDVNGDDTLTPDDLKRAASLYKAEIEIGGDNRAFLAKPYLMLGIVEGIIGNSQEAIRLNGKAVELARSLRNELFLSNALTSLASELEKAGQYDESEQLILEAIELDRKADKNTLYHLALGYADLARLYQKSKRYTEAESRNRDALKLLNENFRQARAEIIDVKNSLGITLLLQGRVADADIWFNDALSDTHEQLPDFNFTMGVLLNNIAVCTYQTREYLLSERTFLAAERYMDKQFGFQSSNQTHATILRNHSDLLRVLGRFHSEFEEKSTEIYTRWEKFTDEFARFHDQGQP